MTVAALSSTYGYAQSDWDAAKEQCRDSLIQKAKTGETITYGELTRKITAIRFDPHEYGFHAMLYEVSVEDVQRLVQGNKKCSLV